MAKLGTYDWKQNIRNGVRKAWKNGKYANIDYRKSLKQRQRLSVARKKYYRKHPKAALEHSRKLKGKMKGQGNPNYGKKHPGLNAGNKNHFWKGGVATLTYRGLGWKRIRENIKKRDNYICRMCGTNDNLHVHHKIPYRISKDNSFNNLITVCNSCHGKIENKFLAPAIDRMVLATD